MTSAHVAGVAPGTGRSHATGAYTQATGLGLMAAAPLLIFAAGALTGSDLGEGMVFLVIGVVLAVASWLAAVRGTWSKVLGLVLTVVAALGGFWLAFGLMAPTSPADFVPAVAYVLGVVLSVGGGVQALRRRATHVTGATAGESRARVVALAAVTVALVGSLAANLLTRSTVDPAVVAGASELSIAGFEFASSEVTVDAGADARLVVANRDAFLHDFTLPEHDVLTTISPGSKTVVDLSALAAGTYTFYCSLHSDTSDPNPESAGMAGTLVIR